MPGKTHLVIPDTHAHWEHSNERADWLSGLIRDLRPDVVIHMGDSADFPSLSGYDKGQRSFIGRTYKSDVDAHLDFQERLWGPVKRTKKRMPDTYFLEGNHEHRIERCLDLSPELTNTVSFNDLDLDRYYDRVVRYEGHYPGSINIDGVTYAHFLLTGISGRPIGGEHGAYQLLTKRFKSCTVAHSHLLDYCRRTDGDNRPILGLFAGCYIDYRTDWAGELNDLWWKGVVFKKDVEGGNYDPQFISLDAIRKEYSK